MRNGLQILLVAVLGASLPVWAQVAAATPPEAGSTLVGSGAVISVLCWLLLQQSRNSQEALKAAYEAQLEREKAAPGGFRRG